MKKIIKLIVYDFDCVMTDNKVYIDQYGNEIVQVNRADGLAVSAFLVTNTCAATAMMIWVILGMFHGGKVSGVGAATGAIAG